MSAPRRADQFNLMLQFSQEVVNDLIKRQLNDPLTTDPHSPQFFPRRIINNHLPDQVQTALAWGTPELRRADDLDGRGGEDDTLAAAVNFEGGFRLPHIERNLSISAAALLRVRTR